MPKFIASLTALTALAAAVLAGIDPWTTTMRAVIAFLCGHLAGSLWEAIFGKPPAEEPVEEVPVVQEVDSEEPEDSSEPAESEEEGQEAEAA